MRKLLVILILATSSIGWVRTDSTVYSRTLMYPDSLNYSYCNGDTVRNVVDVKNALIAKQAQHISELQIEIANIRTALDRVVKQRDEAYDSMYMAGYSLGYQTALDSLEVDDE